MNKIIYQEQSVEELEYNLVSGANIDLDLTILDKQEINFKGGKLNLVIIGSSHYARVNLSNTKNFTEILACINLEEEVNSINNTKLLNKDEFRLEYNLEDNSCYQFNLQTLLLNQKQYQKFNEGLVSNRSNCLHHIFPSNFGLAITAIEYEVMDDRIKWLTYHSYPNQFKIVKTKSILSY